MIFDKEEKPWLVENSALRLWRIMEKMVESRFKLETTSDSKVRMSDLPDFLKSPKKSSVQKSNNKSDKNVHFDANVETQMNHIDQPVELLKVKTYVTAVVDEVKIIDLKENQAGDKTPRIYDHDQRKGRGDFKNRVEGHSISEDLNNENMSFKTAEEITALENIIENCTGSFETCSETILDHSSSEIGTNSPKFIDRESKLHSTPNFETTDATKLERISLVQELIKLFDNNLNKIFPARWGTHIHDEIDEYPRDLVKQRIQQFSTTEEQHEHPRQTINENEEYSRSFVQQRIQQFSGAVLQNDETNSICSQHHEKNNGGNRQSLVQQRIQQLFAEGNAEKIFNFKPLEVKHQDEVTNKNLMEKAVQTDNANCSENHKNFINNLQLLLDFHQSDQSNISIETQYSLDSLEISPDEYSNELPSILRRTYSMEDLFNLESNLEPEFISTSADQENHNYLDFASVQSSSPSETTTPDHYEIIETSSTADYLTPVNHPSGVMKNSVVARRDAEISKKFVLNLFESGRRSLDPGFCLKSAEGGRIIRFGNELHIKDVGVISDKKHVNMNINKHSSEARIDKKINSIVSSNVYAGDNDCVNMEEFDEECFVVSELDDVHSSQVSVVEEMEQTNTYSLKAEEDTEQSLRKDEAYFNLKQEIDVQGIIIQQASKALEACRKSRCLPAGTELVEAERILLAATCRYEMLRKGIQKVKYESPQSQSRNDHNLGNVKISNLMLPLQLNEADLAHFNYYFVLVLHNDSKTFATKATACTSNNCVNFDDTFIFENVNSDCIITINVYCLKIKKTEGKNPLSKKLQSKNNFDHSCSMKKKLFYKDIRTCTLIEASVSKSSFLLCGTAQATLQNLSNDSCSISNTNPGIISNTMNLRLDVSDIRIDAKKKGFLTVSSILNGHLEWNRRWCVLDGPILKFYNYPSDEDLIDPVVTLNLKHCVSGKIEACTKESCAKSRTMLVKIRSVVYFLSADNQTDLSEWSNKLNSILKALNDWNQLTFTSEI